MKYLLPISFEYFIYMVNKYENQNQNYFINPQGKILLWNRYIYETGLRWKTKPLLCSGCYHRHMNSRILLINVRTWPGDTTGEQQNIHGQGESNKHTHALTWKWQCLFFWYYVRKRWRRRTLIHTHRHIFTCLFTNKCTQIYA